MQGVAYLKCTQCDFKWLYASSATFAPTTSILLHFHSSQLLKLRIIVQHISVALSPGTYKSQGRNMLLMMISSIMMDNGNIQQPDMSCSSGIVHHHWCCHPC
ncbi:TPA: hypothetical protein ACH3X3_008788 [Trebouxia sp. C0006]